MSEKSFKKVCEEMGGKVVNNTCKVEKKQIDIPKDVFKLFFRFPHEIRVFRELDGGFSIEKFEQTSTKFIWAKEKNNKKIKY